MQKSFFYLLGLIILLAWAPQTQGQNKAHRTTQKILQTLEPLKKKKWTLKEASTATDITQVIHISFDSLHHGLSVFTGCNTGFIPIEAVKMKKSFQGAFRTGEYISHANTCPKSQTKLHKDFIAQINNQQLRFTIDNDKMTLTNKKKQQLTFSYNPINPMFKYMERFYWKLIQYNGDSSKVYHPYIAFNFEDNTFTGSNGCAPIQGTFTVNQHNNRIHFFIQKKKAYTCLTKHTDKMSETFDGLLNDKSYEFDVADQTLNIYQDDKIILMFGIINQNAVPTPHNRK